MELLTSTRAAGSTFTDWSLAVQGTNINPIGTAYVARMLGVEEIQELHLRGAFAP